MSDTVKLIIAIPREMHQALSKTEEIISSQRSGKTLMNVIYSAVANGTPLDDVKAEIEQIYQGIDTISHNEYENAVEQGKEIAYENVLSILDNIRKAESEDT